MNKLILTTLSVAALTMGLAAATMPASAYDHRNHSNFGITLGFGAPVVGYQDGYYARDGRFTNWNNQYRYDAWSRENEDRAYGYRHDQRRYGYRPYNH